MIVLLDESGNFDTTPSRGASKYFAVGLTFFFDNPTAEACDARIDLLREELGYSHDFEFHFTENSHRVRLAFLEAVKSFDFQYIAVGINKFSEKLPSNLKHGNTELYKYICGIALTSSLPYLDSAKLIIDKSGSKAFQTSLRKYIREELNDKSGERIKKFKPQESCKNNLLQLADYCIGILARKMSNKKGWEKYYSFISPKEISVIDLLK